jgi:hypothetical protein
MIDTVSNIVKDRVKEKTGSQRRKEKKTKKKFPMKTRKRRPRSLAQARRKPK